LREGPRYSRPGADARETIADLARQLLDLDEGELSRHERHIIEHAVNRLAVARDVGLEFSRDLTFGQRLADKVAEVGGSWTFIIVFSLVLGVWMIINTIVLATRAFDPYPFILLNLALSTLAAVQAPIILMSQNRSAARDRLMARHDYEVNLKAEIEIAALHAKLDEIRATELRLLCERVEAAADRVERQAKENAR
jgi:uncharacterized membrane protein